GTPDSGGVPSGRGGASFRRAPYLFHAQTAVVLIKTMPTRMEIMSRFKYARTSGLSVGSSPEGGEDFIGNTPARLSLKPLYTGDKETRRAPRRAVLSEDRGRVAWPRESTRGRPPSLPGAQRFVLPRARGVSPDGGAPDHLTRRFPLPWGARRSG